VSRCQVTFSDNWDILHHACVLGCARQRFPQLTLHTPFQMDNRGHHFLWHVNSAINVPAIAVATVTRNYVKREDDELELRVRSLLNSLSSLEICCHLLHCDYTGWIRNYSPVSVSFLVRFSVSIPANWNVLLVRFKSGRFWIIIIAKFLLKTF
jgi:hypothetical protein